MVQSSATSIEQASVSRDPRRGAAPSVEGINKSEPVPGSASSSVFKSHSWTVDAKKLRGNDKTVVSRPFALAIDGPGGPVITCKMTLHAKTMMEGKGGQSFKLSGGQGSLQLKCDNDLRDSKGSIVELRFSAGTGGTPRQIKHDFSKNASCSLQGWDFSEAVNKKSQTFVVHVEVVSNL
jgi:hypothetical protein